MKTNLPDGSVIKMRYKGRDELYQVTSGGTAYTGVGRHLKKGDTIHVVTWKGDAINVKRSYQLKEDCDWVPALPPPPLDTTAARFAQQLADVQSMAQMMGGNMYIASFTPTVFVLDGHQILYSDGGTSVAVPGAFSWTWLNGPKATAEERTDFTAAHAFARKVLDHYHAELKRDFKAWGGKCIVCDPPHHNVERKK
jgi:hypothetical protein